MTTKGLMEFAKQVVEEAGYNPARHHELLIECLEDVATAKCERLMVQMPPGSAKSTYGSILFPAYFLSLKDKQQVIATSHTASLAEYFGRHVRNLLAEHGRDLGVGLEKGSRAIGHFQLDNGGEYFATGVRGPITGRRADLVIVDDPVKSWAEAESATFRDALFDWYQGELTSRLKPKGRVLLIMTRWHEDDLAGRLLRQDGVWRQLRLPALAEADDVLGRKVGEALWPAWQDEAALDRRRKEVGDRAFQAMYQQSPRPPGETTFKTSNVRVLAEAPVLLRVVRAWDLAATAATPGKNPDYTVGLKLGEAAGGGFAVLDVVRMQGAPAQVEAKILATARSDGKAVLVALPQDPGQAGVAQVEMLRRTLEGFRVDATPERGTKFMRATAAVTRVDAGDLFIVAAPWNDAFLSELGAFPGGAKDDQVDALSRAVNTLMTNKQAPARRMNLPLLNR